MRQAMLVLALVTAAATTGAASGPQLRPATAPAASSRSQLPKITALCDPTRTPTSNDPVAVAPADCEQHPSAGIAAAVGRAEADRSAGRTDQAKKDVADALPQVESPAPQSESPAKPAPPAPNGCGVDDNIYVKPSQARAAVDALALMREAQRLGDRTTAASAQAAAKIAYRDWAEQRFRTDATTVGDYVAIARGAQLLELDDVVDTALANAREVSRANLLRAGVGTGSGCTLDEAGKACRRHAIAIAQWLGVDDAGERDDLQQQLNDLAETCDAGGWSGTITVERAVDFHETQPGSLGTSSQYDVTGKYTLTIAVPETGPFRLTAAGQEKWVEVDRDPRAGRVNTETIDTTCQGTDRHDPQGIFGWGDESGHYEITISVLGAFPCRVITDLVCQGDCGPDNSPVHGVSNSDLSFDAPLVEGTIDPKATSLTGTKTFAGSKPERWATLTVTWNLTRKKKGD